MGVELLDGLFYESVRMTDKLAKKCQLEVSLKQGNLLTEEWSGSDFVYMSNPFEYDMLEKVGVIASLMKVGSWFVTLFKPLPVSE